MSTEIHQRAKAVFLSALELERGAREKYLDQVCGPDIELRTEVDSLLEHGDTETRDFGPLFQEAAQLGKSLLHDRFEEGAVVAGRYRILRPLGAGGMGEVFLAHDDRLEVEVALKFLPRTLAESPESMERLLDEARLARGITHPGVCRIHDVGETDGEPFLSMEYIEGLDLSAFLKRAAVISPARARTMAADLCGAVAAAHQGGVLHGDLKPGNVLVDRDGGLHIADFGLAGQMGQRRPSVESGPKPGSPAYMAPELLAGGETTVASDLFSLGLVLYELAARRRAFDSPQAIILAAQEGAEPPNPGPRTDPVLERVIRRTLAPDPADRPSSAARLEESLRESDDLAAVLHLGELPSPELVAGSGARGLLGARRAWQFLALFVALLAVFVPLASRVLPVQRAAPTLPPSAFAERAEALLDELAPGEGYRHEAYAYSGQDVVEPLESRNEGFRLQVARDGGVGLGFWYRRAQSTLIPEKAWTHFYSSGRTLHDDPPLTHGGTQTVLLGLEEELMFFCSSPQEDAPPARVDGDSGVDWEPFFRHAGLSVEDLIPTKSTLTIPSVADQRSAFVRRPGADGKSGVRVEIGSQGGRPVLFAVFHGESTDDPTWVPDPRSELSGRIYDGLYVVLFAFAVLVGARNLLSGRGDPWGALRLAVFVLAMRLWTWGMLAAHVPDPSEEATLFMMAFAAGLFEALAAWGCYMGVEPLVRRHWPRVLVSWSRVLRGRLRDPLVASHVLIGATAGLCFALFGALDSALVEKLANAADAPVPPHALHTLSGVAGWISTLPIDAVDALLNALVLLTLLVLARILTRRNVSALALAVLVIGTIDVLASRDPVVGWATIGLGQVALGYMILVRFGVLPYAVGLFVQYLVEDFPVSPSLATWYGPSAFFVLPLVIAIAGLPVWVLTRDSGPDLRPARS